jgi:EAL domain-containing protein (putative c-di-GMP-specific phosphodiesterase class I)
MSIDLQPIVDLATGDEVSVEALARFAVYPYSVEGWFAQAHEAGCGAELEMDAVTRAHELLRYLPPSMTLAVNASPDVACTRALFDAVVGAEPSRTVIEITEHRRASRPAALAPALRRLQDHGVQIAIDDAGTGYSDLRQILWLRPDIVKLDQAIVTGVDTDDVKMALVRAFVTFARDAGITLVAEGVSTRATLDRLRELDLAYGQGYALGPPQPADSYLAGLRRSHRRTAVMARSGR